MSSNEKETKPALVFVSGLAETGGKPEIKGAAGGHFVKGVLKPLSPDIVMPKLEKALQEMSEYLNGLQLGEGPYVLDEVRMHMQIDQSGKVQILVADVGGKISSGFVLTWKRRDSPR